MKKIIKKNKVLIVFILILVLQIIAIVYATSKREYYHIDEYYSHGLIQYKRAFIYENEDFIENWHSKEYYKDYLTISDDEVLDFKPVYLNQAEDVHPPIYYLLLRIVCSFNLNNFSIWPGTILNIFFFMLSSVFLFLISKDIFKNKYIALIVCTISGFSIGVIETVMYVRMYQLLTLNILMLIFWHIRKSKKELLEKKDLLQLYGIILLGFLTHYYFCIIAAVLFIMYCIKYMRKKEYKNIQNYIFTQIAAFLTGIIIFPYAIYHIFFSYRSQDVATNLMNFNNICKRISSNAKLINMEVFNNLGNILLVIIFVIGCLWFFTNIIKKRKLKKHKKNTGIIYIVITTIIYLGLIFIASPYIDLRYIMPVIPMIFLIFIYIITDLLQDIFTNKKVYVILGIICLCFFVSVVPKLSNNSYSYKGYKQVLNNIETNLSNKPWIYIYDNLSAKYNKSMECFEALTKIDETYIMVYENVNEENMSKALENKDISEGVMIIVDYTEYEELLEKIEEFEMFKNYEYVGKMGRYRILEVKQGEENEKNI